MVSGWLGSIGCIDGSQGTDQQFSRPSDVTSIGKRGTATSVGAGKEDHLNRNVPCLGRKVLACAAGHDLMRGVRSTSAFRFKTPVFMGEGDNAQRMSQAFDAVEQHSRSQSTAPAEVQAGWHQPLVQALYSTSRNCKFHVAILLESRTWHLPCQDPALPVPHAPWES
jgi:hypothetical protein